MPPSKTDYRSFASFQLSSWRIAIGSRGQLPLKNIQQDATLTWFAQQSEAIDHNGDGQLSTKEVEQFLDLLQAGESVRITISVFDYGRSLWRLLDANQDNQLDARELYTATSRLDHLMTKKQQSLRLNLLPRQVSIIVSIGGTAQLAEVIVPAIKHDLSQAPEWFLKMDRNSDGYLSPREFLGSPDRFKLLDQNNDGFISIQEAVGTKTR